MVIHAIRVDLTDPDIQFLTNQLFDLSQAGTFIAQYVSGAHWTMPSYDDSAWSGPSPGFLWVDVRQTGPNPDVNPKVTQMPSDPDTGYSYPTYYP